MCLVAEGVHRVVLTKIADEVLGFARGIYGAGANLLGEINDTAWRYWFGAFGQNNIYYFTSS